MQKSTDHFPGHDAWRFQQHFVSDGLFGWYRNFSRSLPERTGHRKQLLVLASQNYLKLNFTKWRLAKSLVERFGHTANADRISVNIEKPREISGAPA